MKRTVTLALFSLCLETMAQTPTPQQVREQIAQGVAKLKGPTVEVGSITNQKIPATGADSVAIRIYRPNQSGSTTNLPLIYFIHGGAWVAGDLDTHDNICRRLCHDANAVLVAVDYRRPPEHPYPASGDDAMTVLNWIGANRANLNPSGPLILVGESAGGTFVASTCLRNMNAANPVPIAAQILICPALDVRPGSVTFKNYEWAIRWGLPDITKANDPYISPLASTQLKKMPPTSIAVESLDEIKDDGVQMHQKLQAAGVKSTLFNQEKIGHLGPFWAANNPAIEPTLTFVLQQIAAVK